MLRPFGSLATSLAIPSGCAFLFNRPAFSRGCACAALAWERRASCTKLGIPWIDDKLGYLGCQLWHGQYDGRKSHCRLSL